MQGTNETAIENNNQRLQLLETAAPMWGTNETAIENNNQRLQLLETAAPMWGTNETAISALQTDVDQNESDAEAAILALQSEVVYCKIHLLKALCNKYFIGIKLI